MFDPNKYDNTDSKNTGKKSDGKSFMEKRTDLIKYLVGMKNFITKECEYLEGQKTKTTDEKTISAFDEKLSGWSRILNGTAILNKMYLNN